MRCEGIRNLLTSYILNDLDEVTEERVRAHLKTCEHCRAESWEVHTTLALLRDALAVPTQAPAHLSEDRHHSLLDRFGGLGRKAKWFVTSQHMGLALAAAALFMIAIVMTIIVPGSLHCQEHYAMPKGCSAPHSASTMGFKAKPPSARWTFFKGDEKQADKSMTYENNTMLKQGAVDKEYADEDVESVEGTDSDFDGLTDGVEVKSYAGGFAYAGNVSGSASGAGTVASDAAAKPLGDSFPEPSPTPAKFDSVAIVKSPVIVKGVYGSRVPGARQEMLARHEKEKKSREVPVEAVKGNVDSIPPEAPAETAKVLRKIEKREDRLTDGSRAVRSIDNTKHAIRGPKLVQNAELVIAPPERGAADERLGLASSVTRHRNGQASNGGAREQVPASDPSSYEKENDGVGGGGVQYWYKAVPMDEAAGDAPAKARESGRKKKQFLAGTEDSFGWALSAGDTKDLLVDGKDRSGAVGGELNGSSVASDYYARRKDSPVTKEANAPVDIFADTRPEAELGATRLAGVEKSMVHKRFAEDQYSAESRRGKESAGLDVERTETANRKPNSAVIFSVPDLDDKSSITYTALANAKAGKMGKGGGTHGGWPEGMQDFRIRFIRLEHGGQGWDDGMRESGADANFLREFAKLTGFKKVARKGESEPISLLRKYPKDGFPPFVYLTGEGDMGRVSSRDIKTLRDYCLNGGMIFADAGSSGFHKSFLSFMRQVFPEKRLVDIADDDMLYQIPFSFPNGAPAFWNHAGSRPLGVKDRGRWMVFYHPGDMNDAWKSPGYVDVTRDRRDAAVHLGVNVVYYAFSQWYKAVSKIREGGKPEVKEPEEDLSGPRFKAVGVNPFYAVSDKPFSTFAIDVDTASYTLTRNYMSRGLLPMAESVRTEEFVNFFDYAYKAPSRDTFKVYAQCAPSKFGHGLDLLKIGVKGRRIGREEQRQAVLTFLIDSSGSMDQPDRIGLIRKSLKLLVNRLSPNDLVSIIQYDSHARVILDHTPASKLKEILAAVDSIRCGGSTNLGEGMEKAYELAASSFVSKGENRVLLMSDGVANLGAMGADEILKKVEKYREQGIYCSVFGFGIGTYDDNMLETLANKGDGTYKFIDSEREAQKVFVDDLAATLNTIASDVKIQVEFNPKTVNRYRQLGYENRQLTKEQFRDDTVDAGEVGSGQSVTALYECDRSQVSGVRCQVGEDRDAVLATVRVRYRRTDNNEIEEIERKVRVSDVMHSFDDMDSRFKLAACAAEFAEILRACPHAAGSSYDDVADALTPVAMELNLDKNVQEFLGMVKGARGMARASE